MCSKPGMPTLSANLLETNNARSLKPNTGEVKESGNGDVKESFSSTELSNQTAPV